MAASKEIGFIKEPEVFHSKYLINNESGCWEWQGNIGGCGYGNFYQTVNGVQRTFRAHRVAWFLLRGEPDPLLVLDHVCRNKRCVNPDHLREVTCGVNNIENSLSPTAINKIKTHCKNGHELNAENTSLKQGSRRCVICTRALTRKHLDAAKIARKAAKVEILNQAKEQWIKEASEVLK